MAGRSKRTVVATAAQTTRQSEQRVTVPSERGTDQSASRGPTRSRSKQNRPGEAPHPHGFIGYVVEDKQRTQNCLRLLRWLIVGAIAAGGVLALVLWLMLQLTVLAGVVGGLSSIAAAGAAWHARNLRQALRR
ncbi:hypothetical protein SAMN04489731_11415 [Amycolatopsis regifaucium]|nr:hypothetical protein SAMN04489731_11415 [Amycolatopsis regifaucium]